MEADLCPLNLVLYTAWRCGDDHDGDNASEMSLRCCQYYVIEISSISVNSLCCCWGGE